VSGKTFNAGNAMTAFNGQALSYDANGNLTNDGTNTYTWDARNHLSAISGGVSASFVYDPSGRRMNKTIGGTMTQFLYDGLNPVQELDGASPPNVTANLLTGLGIDEYFTRTDSSGTANFLTDNLGSVIALANSSSSIATSYTYEPFGNVTVNGSNGNPYQFTGRENDGTGLYFYRVRYYSPTYQRFIAQDPPDFEMCRTALHRPRTSVSNLSQSSCIRLACYSTGAKNRPS
jgi:RHS repeat-associated protein